MAQLPQRALLDLAAALARQMELLADLLERPRSAPVETEAQPQDLALAVVEIGEQMLDAVLQDRRAVAVGRLPRLGEQLLPRVAVLFERLGEREEPRARRD